MTLKKITIDNSVRYVPISEKTKETDIKPKNSLPRKPNKNISQNNEKFIKNVAASGFSKLTK